MYASLALSQAWRFSYQLAITTRLYWPVTSVMMLIFFSFPIASLNILASFVAFPGLQTNISWTMIINRNLLSNSQPALMIHRSHCAPTTVKKIHTDKPDHPISRTHPPIFPYFFLCFSNHAATYITFVI